MPALLKATLSGLAAVLFGAVLLAAVDLPAKWLVCLVGLCGAVGLAVLSRDPERLFLGVFFLVIPIPIANFIGQLSTIHRGGAPGYFVTLSDLPLLALYLLWIPQILDRSSGRFKWSPGLVCLFGVIAMSVLSTLNAIDTRFSHYEIARLAIVVLIYFYMANAPAVARHRATILTAAMVHLGLEGILGVLQFATGRGIALRLAGEGVHLMKFENFSRAAGTMGHPNTYAFYLGLLLPLAVSVCIMQGRLGRRALAAASFVFGLTGLVFSFSRGGWLGFLLSLGVWTALVLKYRLVDRHRLAAIFGIGALVLIVAGAVFSDPIHARLTTDDAGSAYSRIPLMRVALNMIRAHPFLGVGSNNYVLAMPSYDTTPEGIAFTFLDVVHNGYLLIASQIGLPGLLCFLGLIGFMFHRGLRFLGRRGDPAAGLIVAGVLAGVSSMLLQMGVENVYLTYQPVLIFWALAGMTEALTRAPARRPAPVEAIRPATAGQVSLA